MKQLITLLLAGLSVGLGNFAASVAIGLGGVSKELRLKLVLVFGLFETGMPIIGLLVGQHIAGSLGSSSNIIGGVLLTLTGLYLIYSALKHTDDSDVKKAASGGMGKLLITALSLSIDNLIIGFTLGAHQVPLVESAITIGITSVVLSLVGLEIGSRLSSKVEEYSEVLSGVILILVGLAIGFKLL